MGPISARLFSACARIIAPLSAFGGRGRGVRQADATAFRVARPSPMFSQRRTAAPLPPAIQRWAEGRNPFRIEAAGGGHEVRTRPHSAPLAKAGD